MASELIVSEELIRFVSENTTNGYAFQIVLFFADHPYAQFNELAIIHALNRNGGRLYLQKALKALGDKGIIKRHTDSNVLLYSLSENRRSLASELAKFDVPQRQQLLRQTPLASTRKEGRVFRDMALGVLAQFPRAATTGGCNSTIFDQEELHRD